MTLWDSLAPGCQDTFPSELQCLQMLASSPFLIAIAFFDRQVPDGHHLIPRCISKYTQQYPGNPGLCLQAFSNAVISMISKFTLNLELFSGHGGPHLLSKHGTAHSRDKDCSPGISPTDTPNPDGSPLPAHLTTHSKKHAPRPKTH